MDKMHLTDELNPFGSSFGLNNTHGTPGVVNEAYMGAPIIDSRDFNDWNTSTASQPSSSDPSSTEWQSCFHEEHLLTGCVNPLEVLKSVPITLSNCCCDDPTHIPTPADIIRSRRDHQVRQANKASRRRSRSPGQSLSDIINDGEASSGTHSRTGSLHMSMLELSSMPSISDYQQDFNLSRVNSNSHQCQWLDSVTKFPCTSLFPDAGALQTHIENDHISANRQYRSRKFKMEHCCHWGSCEAAMQKKAFRQVQHLKDHVRTHTQYKPFMCKFNLDDQLCNKEFGDRKALESHVRSHTKEKPFKCKECYKFFSHQSSLATHRAQHYGQKRYQCPECPHMDNDRANLGRHFDTHFENRFSCRYCFKTFSKKANGMRHLKNGSCKQVKAFIGRNLNQEEIDEGILQRPRQIDLSTVEFSVVYAPEPVVDTPTDSAAAAFAAEFAAEYAGMENYGDYAEYDESRYEDGKVE